MRVRNRWVALGGVVAAAWLAAPAAGVAQIGRGQYDVNVGGGVVFHENASALVSASPAITFQARYLVTDLFSLGVAADYIRTKTDDDVFPLAQFRFADNDSTILLALTQPVAAFHYQVVAGLERDAGRLHVHVLGGVGGYRLYTDPQLNSPPTAMQPPIVLSDFAFSFGGGVRVAVTEDAGIGLSVRDVVYTGYDRDLLYPLREPIRVCNFGSTPAANPDACQNERFPHLNPVPPEKKSTLHNLSVTLSFAFRP
jgi:opacity protein-like surface antigen